MPLTQQELGRRIRSARENSSLTQEQLGELVKLPRVAITQIEAGARAVSSLELDRIAFSLGRDIRSFFVEEFDENDALAALFRSDPEFSGQLHLMQALQASLALGYEVTNLEQLLGIDRAQLLAAGYDLAQPQSKWEAIQQGERIARQERQRLDLGTAPIIDIAEILEVQGIRTGAVDLPDDISGLTLCHSKIGVFIVVNSTQALLRRRFSFAHEYAHALVDRHNKGALSRAVNRSDLLEVRANAFAAEFLMPTEGIKNFVSTLGKGSVNRQIAVFDEAEVVQVDARSAPGSQDIQLYDIARLSHHFGVSRGAMLYRLRNLRMLSETEFQVLDDQERSGAGKAIAELLNANESSSAIEDHQDFKRRFLTLALEAYRREEISQSKFTELANMVAVNKEMAQSMLDSAGLN
ncbi:ImmA/IrrE family metallo-endopeptidase [Duganella sp. FT50W]|uniref:ImmA/IrrE family metallo-endopeptidase n=1 Tax=Duganella lactea TaxID=2692173 RepID=A0A6L8MTH0_9BURK|nr:XRE family transcriptional regulator [Duganella lactea]MYM85346.1 ImmA/IrrE family metallo-endopeptidase [Duganella lactea]